MTRAEFDVLNYYHSIYERDDVNEEVEEHEEYEYAPEHERSSNTMNGEKLTLDEAIKNHRMMWKWISRESISQKRKVAKEEAFKHFGWPPFPDNCWCCMYNNSVHKDGDAICSSCPVKWPDGTCFGTPAVPTLYTSWVTTDDYVMASFLADRIAILPVNEKLYNKKDGDLMIKRQMALLDEFVDYTTKLTQVAKKWMDLIKEMDRES